MYAHVNHDPPDATNIDDTIPEGCQQIVRRAMCKQPEDRYQTAEELLDALTVQLANCETKSNSSATANHTVKMTADELRSANDNLAGETMGGQPRNLADLDSHVTKQVQPKSSSENESPPWTRRLILGGGLLLAIGFIWFAFFGGGNKNKDQGGGIGPASKSPISVGVVVSRTGTHSAAGTQSLHGFELAVEQINASGGVNGHPIQLVIRDGKSDVQVFADATEELLTKEKVMTLFGGAHAAARKAIRAKVESLDHLFITTSVYEGLEQSPNLFYCGAAPNQTLSTAIQWCSNEKKFKRFYIVGSDSVYSRVAAEILKDQIKQAGGSVVGEQFRAMGSGEFQVVAKEIATAKPDVVLNTLQGDSNIKVRDVLDGYIDAVLGSGQSGFQTHESGLHQENKSGANQDPTDIDKLLFHSKLQSARLTGLA